ncbi:MAG: hypothetical protein NVSMB57_07090 [Actinomycetota bacterium]
MRRRTLITVLSITMLAALAGGVVLAGVRLSARHAAKAEAAQVKLDRLRFIDAPDPNANPFAVQPGGPGAPPLPTLPADNAQKSLPSVTNPGFTIPAAYEHAIQTDGDAASSHWALIIGINVYSGGTRNNIGSFQDAQTLHDYLISLGWRTDHVLLIGNRAATSEGILTGLRWLESHTNERSTAIFHYSGHEKPRGHGSARHIMLWASDNSLLQDSVLAAHLGNVRASRMWINMAVCRADGFNKPGMVRDGRVVTFSSPESELSYEDPNVHHSVFGYNLLVRGIIQGLADPSHKGAVSVQQAFRYSVPYVIDRTAGNQHPVMVDRYPGGHFTLRIS